jgi:ComF family protein
MQGIRRRLSRNILDALAPEHCAACAATVTAETLFCHACHDAVNVLGAPLCVGCGSSLRDAPCPHGDAPPGSARAFARYDADAVCHPVAEALHAFKYRGAWRLAPRLASAMAACASGSAVAPLVVPVPLHATRLRARGFNQSALLAWQVGRIRRWPVAPRLLVRTRDTPSQTTLTAAARHANVDGAFALRRLGTAHHRRILVIDDVWTSGATARAIARVLGNDGAAVVDILTFARVD